MKLRRADCPMCHKTVAVQPPAGGDGTIDVFPRHQTPEGEPCISARRMVWSTDYVEEKPEQRKLDQQDGAEGVREFYPSVTGLCECGHPEANHHRFHPHECWDGRCDCPAFRLKIEET
jgi:hypothetical protein